MLDVVPKSSAESTPKFEEEISLDSPPQSSKSSSPESTEGLEEADSHGHQVEKKSLTSPVLRPFKRAAASIRTWKELRAHIESCMVKLAKRERDVLEGIYNYRMVVSSLAFKPQKLDEDIWGMYQRIQDDLPGMKKKTTRFPLVLHSNKSLRTLDRSWQELVNVQDSLLDYLEKAPKSVDFYNRIHLARIKRKEQELREGEISRRNAQAKEAIELAVKNLGISMTPTESAHQGSTILRLDEARNYWQSRLQEVMNLEASANMDPEEIVHVFKTMEDTITEAPHWADRVREIDVMFARLMSMHDDLNNYGKTIIPSEDLARMVITVQDEIPKLWATGSWEKLRRTLNEVSNFVKFYDLPVRSELSLAERRKPGLTRALSLGTTNIALSQITPLVRSLVSAIDARDIFMRGHSDAVAKTSVQIARKMGWSGEDLEFLEIAGLLHDVGKIVIPETLLTKTDPLSPDDWRAIQTHPYHGARIVKTIDSLNRIAPWIYHHQERWDGKGYPDQISDQAIPVAARIIAVSEAFTAMISDQPKRKALTMDEATAEISRGIGSQFDPDSAGALVQSIESSEISSETYRK